MHTLKSGELHVSRIFFSTCGRKPYVLKPTMINYLFNSKFVLSTSRYPWIDYVRGITIILVVYRHVFEGLVNVGEGSISYPFLKYTNIFLFSFRMPLFFIVSGLFVHFSLKKKGIAEYINKRFSTIFYPLLVWGSIHISLQLLFADYVHANRIPMDYLNLIIWPRRIEQYWYLNALFFVGALYAIIKVKLKFTAWMQVLTGVVLFAVASFIRDRMEIGFLIDVMFFYMFFAIGDLIADFILNTKNYKWLTSVYTMLVILPLFLFIQHQFTLINLEAKDDYFVQYHMPALYAVAALVGAGFIINIAFILERYNLARVFRVIGYHSLYIYVMHLMITAFTRIFFVRVLNIDNVLPIMIVSLILGIVIPIIVFNITNRMGAWWLYTSRKKERVPVQSSPGININYKLVAEKEQ